MAQRTDIHRPSAIVTADYDFIGFEYTARSGDPIGDALFLQEQRANIRRHMEVTGGTWSTHAHGGSCHVCGAHAIYTVLFWHRPSNSYVRTGGDCAQHIDNVDDTAFRSKCREAIEAKAGKGKAQAILGDAGLLRAWDICQLDGDALIELGAVKDATPSRDFYTLRDMVSKLTKYGSSSEKQINYMHVLVKKIDGQKALEVKWAAEKDAADPCPTGKVTITGKVLKTEFRETQWGGSMKATIKADAGFIVWGTMPSAQDWKRGDHVTFIATITVSDRDPKFGFYKSPSKARTLATAS